MDDNHSPLNYNYHNNLGTFPAGETFPVNIPHSTLSVLPS